jgi:glycosyltransferase involved in cell wall biosynthesis
MCKGRIEYRKKRVVMRAENILEKHQKLDSNKPIVSIGMPVFNGEKYLKQALDSILAQTYKDFELIISDNASTDRTQQICRVYASRDGRIHYYRNKRNLGAPRNFNRVFKLSQGKYFKWAAYDDIIAPEYLEKCVDILVKDPSVVLCHSRTGRINEIGVLVGNYDHKMKMDSVKPHERFGDLIDLKRNPCWPIFGVTYASIMKMTPLHGDYLGADGNLLAELSLYGRIYEIPEYLFFRRDHPQAYTQKYVHTKKNVSYREQLAWWGSNSWINLSILKNCFEFLSSVGRVPLKWSERILCYEQIFKWFIREGWRLLGLDVERYFLNRSNFGRTMASVVQKILRRTVIPLVERDT